MNQILKPEINFSPKKIENSNQSTTKKVKQNHFYLFQFLLSSFIACLFLIFFFIRMYQLNENEKLSKQLIKDYQLSTLYANNAEANYIAERVASSSNVSFNGPFVIGLLKIDKIKLTYPILSHSNKELLNISVCRFAGPMPHEVR